MIDMIGNETTDHILVIIRRHSGLLRTWFEVDLDRHNTMGTDRLPKPRDLRVIGMETIELTGIRRDRSEECTCSSR